MLTDWLAAYWMTQWLIDQLPRSLTDHMWGSVLTDWLAYWVTQWLIDQLARSLTDHMWSSMLTDWLTEWLCDWLTNLLVTDWSTLVELLIMQGSYGHWKFGEIDLPLF